jgi:hypothetical protein
VGGDTLQKCEFARVRASGKVACESQCLSSELLGVLVGWEFWGVLGVS